MKITQKELAEIFGVTTRRIRDMQSQEGLPSIKNGRATYYDLKAVWDWRSEKLKADNQDPLKLERMRLIKSQADIKEKTVQVLNMELLPLSLMMEFTGNQAKAIKQKLLSIPSKVKNQIPGVDNKTIKFIDKQIKETLNDLDKTKMPADLQRKLNAWIKSIEGS